MRSTTCNISAAIITLLLASCKPASSQQFTEMDIEPMPDFDPGYREFCQMNLSAGDPEQNAVLCAFYGDYENALEQATKISDIA